MRSSSSICAMATRGLRGGLGWVASRDRMSFEAFFSFLALCPSGSGCLWWPGRGVIQLCLHCRLPRLRNPLISDNLWHTPHESPQKSASPRRCAAPSGQRDSITTRDTKNAHCARTRRSHSPHSIFRQVWDVHARDHMRQSGASGKIARCGCWRW